MFWRKDKDETVENLARWVMELSTKVEKQQKQIDLILKELGKDYVPKKSVTKPAKLVTAYPPLSFEELMYLSIGGTREEYHSLKDKDLYNGIRVCGREVKVPKNKAEKKKRGRPKGSKNKK